MSTNGSGTLTAISQLPELRLFLPEERWTYVGGFLVVAERSPDPPALLAADGHPASCEYVAALAGVSPRLVRRLMEPLRERHLLEHDEDRPSRLRVPVAVWEVIGCRSSDGSRERARDRKRRERARRKQEPRLV